MRQWLERMMWKFQEFMRGRYGPDRLFVATIIAALVGFVISSFPFCRWVSILTWLLLIWGYFRFFSKNISKRQAENAKFCAFTDKIRGAWSRGKHEARDRKTYRYFKCPKCGQRQRAPRLGKTILVTCPSCGEKFKKKV